MVKRSFPAPSRTLDGWLERRADAPLPPSAHAPLRLHTFRLHGFSQEECAPLIQHLCSLGASVLDATEAGECSHVLCKDLSAAAAELSHEPAPQLLDHSGLSSLLHPQQMMSLAEMEAPEGTRLVEASSEEGRAVSPCLPEIKLPPSYVDAWDEHHVRLPCSPRAMGTDGSPLWSTICAHLSRPPSSVDSLITAMGHIRCAMGGTWELCGIKEVLTCVLDDHEREAFFKTILPALCSLALRLPELFPTPLPLLRAGRASHVSVSAEQCACLLSHAFFCTYPGRNMESSNKHDALCPFSFGELHGSLHPPRRKGSVLSAIQAEKWRCLLQYWSAIASRLPPTGAGPLTREVTFERRVCDNSELEWSSFWLDAEQPIAQVIARSDGTIEDAGPDMLQVDFANRVLGGGVLRNGCVQEEIRFLISPELIVSRLLTEPLRDHEAMIMSGFERFCSYTGYASSFSFYQPYDDKVVLEGGRVKLVAIDATNFGRIDRMKQFDGTFLEREVNKAFIGFSQTPMTEPASTSISRNAHPLPVCTGNWGCGAFHGDLQLKALLQLIAASAAHCPSILYLTFGDVGFASRLQVLTERLRALDCRVGMLVNLLQRFRPSDWPPTPSTPNGCLADAFAYLEEECRSHEKRSSSHAKSRQHEHDYDHLEEDCSSNQTLTSSNTESAEVEHGFNGASKTLSTHGMGVDCDV